jgi:hypothetical protein
VSRMFRSWEDPTVYDTRLLGWSLEKRSAWQEWSLAHYLVESDTEKLIAEFEQAWQVRATLKESEGHKAFNLDPGGSAQVVTIPAGTLTAGDWVMIKGGT